MSLTNCMRLALIRISNNRFNHKTTYRVAPKKLPHFVLYILTSSNITDSQNCVTARIRRIFLIILPPKIPLHLKCVAKLPSEMSVLKAIRESSPRSCSRNSGSLLLRGSNGRAKEKREREGWRGKGRGKGKERGRRGGEGAAPQTKIMPTPLLGAYMT